MNNGYIEILMPEHPNARKNGTVLEHRLVAEEKLGRLLDKKEVVHHLDEDRTNNAPENLIVFRTNSDHSRFHKVGILKDMGDGTHICPIPSSKIIKCEFCGGFFIRTNYKSNKRFCSLECYTKSNDKFTINGTLKPNKEELFNLINSNSYKDVGKLFGVSDGAVRRWCKKYDISPQKRKKNTDRNAPLTPRKLLANNCSISMSNEEGSMLHDNIHSAINFVRKNFKSNASERAIRVKIVNSSKHKCKYLGYNWDIIQEVSIA